MARVYRLRWWKVSKNGEPWAYLIGAGPRDIAAMILAQYNGTHAMRYVALGHGEYRLGFNLSKDEYHFKTA